MPRLSTLARFLLDAIYPRISFPARYGESSFLRTLGVAFAAVLFAFPTAAAGEEDAMTFEQHVAVVQMSVRHSGLPPATTEPQFTELLPLCVEDEDFGRVYSAIAQSYCQAGLRQPERAERFARQALEHTLPPGLHMQTLVMLGDALQVRNSRTTGEALISARNTILRTYLSGVRIALDNDIPPERVEVPEGGGFFNYRGSYDDPAYLKRKQELDDINAAQQNAISINKLVDWRHALETQIVYVCTRWPIDAKDLEALVSEALKDDEATKRVLSLVQESVLKRNAEGPELADSVFSTLVNGDKEGQSKAAIPQHETAPPKPVQSASAAPTETPGAKKLGATTKKPGSDNAHATQWRLWFAGGIVLIVILWFGRRRLWHVR